MHRNRRRGARVALVGGIAGLLVGGASFLTSAPASARVCAEGRVWVAGSPTGTGACVPFMESWIQNCGGADVFPLGYGAGAEFCVPTPV